MKKAPWKLFVFLVLLTTSVIAGCGRSSEPTLAVPEPLPPQKFASADFDSAGQCQYCHLEIFEQWRGTPHALSAKNQVFMAELKRTSRETNGAADQFCVGCHLPVGALAEEIPPVDGSALSDVSRQGVSCDFCHTITEVNDAASPAYRVTPGKVKYGPFDDPLQTPLHQSEYSKLHTQSDFCAACHEIIHPENGLALATTFSEWQQSSFGSKRITCQDCHMTPGPGVSKPNPGTAATGAPKVREHTWTHDIVGNNVMSLRRAGYDGQAAKAEENLKTAAALFLGLPERLSPYQSTRINVRIRNNGAGHYLPTGLSLYKDMWLEVICTNEAGQVVHSSGVLTAAGTLPENTVVFKTTFADVSGKETDNLWEAVRVLDDHRIPPQKYVDEFVEVPGLPLPGTLNIQVRLLYRNMTAERAVALGIPVNEIPVLEMAKVTGRVAVR